MPAAKVVCPSCGASLTLKNPVAPGKSVRCPKCQSTFRPDANRPAARAAAKSAPPPKAAERESAPRHRDRDDDDSRRPRKKSAKRKKANPVLLWSVIGLGAVVVIGGTLAILWATGVIGGGGPVADTGPGPGKQPAGNQALVGRWEPEYDPLVKSLAFETDGTVFAEISEGGKEFLVPGTYRLFGVISWSCVLLGRTARRRLPG